MSGICVAKLCCDICGSKTGKQVFADEETGALTSWCFSCETYSDSPYGEGKTLSDIPKPKKKTASQIAAELAEIGSYQSLGLPERKLGSKSLEAFGAKVSVSERDGKTPTASYWPITHEGKITGYHVKPLWKGSYPYNLGETTGGDMIGWEQAKKSGAYRLIITEGPEDAASVLKVFQVYGKPEYLPAVCSLPRGAGSAEAVLNKHARDIKTVFKEVVFCFDDDESGRKAVKKASLILPLAKTVKLPYKDANDCLKQGVAKALYQALSFQATKPLSTSLILAKDLHEQARKPAQWGTLSWPWPKLDNLTRGIREGETIYIGGPVKSGKGEIRDSVAAHFIKEHDTKIMMASYEQSASIAYKRMVAKIARKIFHDPKIAFDEEAYDKAGEIIGEKAIFLDRYQRASWDNVKEDIVASAAWGAKAFFIDPITNFTAGMEASAANTFLSGMAREASELMADLGGTMFLFCHLKAPEGDLSSDSRQKKYDKGEYWNLGNCPHERGGTINSNQFAGSRAMMQACNMMIGLETNKDDTLPETIKNTRRLAVIEDREYGETGTFPLYWNKNTGTFEEI